MYLPPQFVAKDAELVRQLMREHPFATLVSMVPTAPSVPFISQLPIVSSEINSDPVLLGHLAKPNPHSKVLFESGTHQLLFSGPNAYMSPSVYEDKNKVPTWSYLSVLVTGTMTPVVGHVGLDALLKRLIAEHEPAYAEQWRGIPLSLQETLLNAIVGFEFHISKLEAKFKLNQHRPESHAAMFAQLSNIGVTTNSNEQQLALWMKRLKLV